MKIIYISSEDKTRKNLYIASLSSFLSKDNEVLIINMEKDRELEMLFEVEDYIIYDNLDYFSEVSDLEQSVTEIEDNLDILPSAFKLEKYEMQEEDYKKITLIENYDYIIVNTEVENIKYIENIEVITDELLEYKQDKMYFINNRLSRNKINRKRKEIFEKEGYTIIGDMLINESTSKDSLDNLWGNYIGISEYKMDRNIIERILNL